MKLKANPDKLALSRLYNELAKELIINMEYNESASILREAEKLLNEL